MDILITVLLLIVAGCVVFGKPIQITVLHKYDNPPLPTPDPMEELRTQQEENGDALKAMDAVIQSLHNIMGVSNDVNNT